jgi:hypothetical protein
MADKRVPNKASAKSKAEGDRWHSDSETVERYDQIENQTVLPPAGESGERAPAGHGDRNEKEER